MFKIDVRSLGLSDYVEMKVNFDNGTSVDCSILNRQECLDIAEHLADVVDTLRYMYEDEYQRCDQPTETGE